MFKKIKINITNYKNIIMKNYIIMHKIVRLEK